LAKTKGKKKSKSKSSKKAKISKKSKPTKKAKISKKSKPTKKAKISKKSKPTKKAKISKKSKPTKKAIIETKPEKIITHGTLPKGFDSTTLSNPKVETPPPAPKVETPPPAPKVETPPPAPTISAADAAVEAQEAVRKASAAEAASKKAREVESSTKKQAMEAAEKEYGAISKEVEAAVAEAVSASTRYTDKHREQRIFRREMGEPEFWLDKNGLAPPRPILTPEEEQDISRKALIPSDNTPAYVPDHVLSPEFSGMSNYESGVSELLQENKLKLDRLKADPNSSRQEIEQVELDLKKLNYLHENFNLGMNVFRTARGGRSKLRE